MDRLAPAKSGAPRIERREIAPAATIARAPLAFGDTDLSTIPMLESPEGDWRRAGIDAQPVACFIIRDALIHSSAGLIVLDDFVLAETLHHAYPPIYGFEYKEEGKVFLLSSKTVRSTEPVIHLLGGGAQNIYHWMIDILSRAPVCRQLPEAKEAVHLLPPLEEGFQRQSVDLLTARTPWRISHLANYETAVVGELIFVPTMTGSGWQPHPQLLRLCYEMRPSALTVLRRPSRRIYIDRRGATHRPLSNEADLVHALQERGFEALRLETMPLREQIAAFAEATIVVAPHGAGLANLLFSLSGVAVIELMMDGYVNWCMRNLAALKFARYGCVIGKTDGAWNPAWPHSSSWTISIPRVIAAVEAAG